MFIDTKAGDIFSDEYIKAHDEKFVNAQKQAMQAIIDDGFISYPLWFDNLDGETVEKEAWLPPTFEPSCSEGFEERHGMRYNIYVPSYERAGTAQTIQMLDEYNVKNYYILDKAGAYAIQEWIGFIGITKIDGSYFNVMGLPTQLLYNELIMFANNNIVIQDNKNVI